MRRGVVKDPVFYRDWAVAHPFCQGCGIGARRAPFPGLSTHHLVKPGRSDEPCNLLRLCHRCHERAEGVRVATPERVLPPVLPGVWLNVKRLREPADWDPARLEQLLGHALPRLETVPVDLARSWLRWGRRPKAPVPRVKSFDLLDMVGPGEATL